MAEQIITRYNTGDKIKVTSVDCGFGLCKRLGEMGLYEGSELEIIKNDGSGPIVVKILNSQVALGRGEAQKIYGCKI